MDETEVDSFLSAAFNNEDNSHFQVSEKRDEEWMSLPANANQIWQLYQSGKRHPAMKLAYSALRMKRSPTHVFLLLVGLSGAGKSSTINYLFDKQIALINESESQTRSTDEFVVTMASKMWRIPDLKLSVIDTPGFNDTAGLEQDAKNMASIERFLQDHKHMQNSYPNIVFIVVNILDNRITGANSLLAKMLRGLSKINAVDHQNPNVVLVFTHAGQLARKRERWIEQAERKKTEVTAIVKLHLGVTPEIVFQENLPDDFELKKVEDWHILPNGEKQPKTLFQACKRILNISCDELGHEAMAICFRPGEVNTIVKGLSISSSKIDTEHESKLYSYLVDSDVTGPHTEVWKMLEVFKQKQDSLQDERNLSYEICLLQKRLSDIQIHSAKEIQSMTMNALVSKMYPMRIDREREKILESVFGIKFKQLSGYDYHIGSGYNVFTDTKKTMQPLMLSGSSNKFGLPDNVLLKECTTCNIKCQAVKTENEYIEERLKDIRVSWEGSPNYGLFRMNIQNGYNLDNAVSSKISQDRHRSSFLLEQRMFKADIEKPFKLNPELVREIEKLPDDYNPKDGKNINRWKAFFEKWGYYVITGGYMGGSLSGYISSSKLQTATKACEDAHATLEMKLSFLEKEGKLDYTTDGSEKNTNGSFLNNHAISRQWNGGDRDIHNKSFENITSEDWKRWVTSLEYAPAALWTSLDLYPMYLLAAEVSQEKADIMQEFMNMELFGKAQRQPELDNRKTVGKSHDSGGCFHPLSVVFLSNGKTKLIKDLVIGDRVLIIDNNSSIEEDVVISWIHKKTRGMYSFLKITHSKGCICLTPEHIVFVAIGAKQSAQLASSIKPGHELVFKSHSSKENPPTVVTVLSVNEVVGTGIYAPLTISGRLIVDGIAASCYCSIAPVTLLGREIISSHSLAHFGFLPLRIAYHVDATDINRKIDKKNWHESLCSVVEQ